MIFGVKVFTVSSNISYLKLRSEIMHIASSSKMLVLYFEGDCFPDLENYSLSRFIVLTIPAKLI